MIWVEQAQDAENVPHFCYHDATMNLDFAWDGFALEIDVSQDGEVVGKYPIPVGHLSKARNPGRWLAHFEVLCQVYIKEKVHEGLGLVADPGGVLPLGLGGGKSQETTIT